MQSSSSKRGNSQSYSWVGAALAAILALGGESALAAPVETVLHSFTDSPDGATPEAGLILDAAGNLYGTTYFGGASGAGTVFKLTRPAPGQTAWTESVLHSFTDTNEANPNGDLVLDGTGSLYGTTLGLTFGGGTVFKLTPPAPGQTAWTKSVLHSFTDSPDGAGPEAGLILDGAGNLYGTTADGGLYRTPSGELGYGTVFKLAPPAPGQTAWTVSVLHSFTGSDGFSPSTLITDGKGNLYGTAQGGVSGNGLAFKLTPPAPGQTAWAVTVLHSFTDSPDGSQPSRLIADGAGTLYGTTLTGGVGKLGTVYKLSGTGFVPPPQCSAADASLVNKKFPPGQMTYDVSSPSRALQSISLLSSSNIGSFTLPTVQSGGHSATGGIFTKADAAKSATFELQAAFVDFTCTIDPLTTTLRINSGHKVTQSFQPIPRAEHFIEISDGRPGLHWLRIEVNGKYFRTLNLLPGRTANIDASEAMNLDQNTLTFTGAGPTGSFANIDVSDSAPAAKKPMPWSTEETSPRETGIWGHLTFEKEVP